jgi:hypothetical protein
MLGASVFLLVVNPYWSWGWYKKIPGGAVACDATVKGRHDGENAVTEEAAVHPCTKNRRSVIKKKKDSEAAYPHRVREKYYKEEEETKQLTAERGIFFFYGGVGG